MKPVQTINRKVEVTNMKSNEINTDITLMRSEAETISKKLVEAGIDRELVERVIGSRVPDIFAGCGKAGNCHHCGACDKYFRAAAEGCPKASNCVHKHGCDKYFRAAGPSDIEELRKQILERTIDIKKIHPKAEKLFRG